jgi:hypothetical protein
VFSSVTSLSVLGTNTLAILPFQGLQPWPDFNGFISGHVSFTAFPGSLSGSRIAGTLSPGALVDVLKGAVVTVENPSSAIDTLRGSGALNIAGGTIKVLRESAADLNNYFGPIILQSGGRIIADTSLGHGPLVLRDGQFIVSNPMHLANRQTALSNGVDFEINPNVLTFDGDVLVPADVQATLHGGEIAFLQGISFLRNTTKLTFSGSGTVKLKTLTPQVLPANANVTIKQL